MSDPHFQLVTQTQIDLKVIQEQLDTIESTLLMAWRSFGISPYTDEQAQQVSLAIDTLLAVKKSFGLTSDLLPVQEQQHATTVKKIMMPLAGRPEEAQ